MFRVLPLQTPFFSTEMTVNSGMSVVTVILTQPLPS